LTPKKREKKNLKKEEIRASSSYTSNQQENAEQLTTTAFSLTDLQKFSLDDLATLRDNVDTLLAQHYTNATKRAQPISEEISIPSHEQKIQDSVEKTEKVEEVKETEIEEAILPIEHPGENAPRTAKTIVQLIEYLRGQRFVQQGAQLRDAQILLAIQPPVSLHEIEEAWRHGSDDYWRERDPLGMTVSDLKNREKISGKPRILACLEHKRLQDRKQHRMVYTSHSFTQPHTESRVLQTPVPKPPVSSLSEEQAKVLAQRITEDGQTQNYILHGTAVPLETGGWKVVASWQSSAWRGDLGLEIFSDQQWQKEFKSWQEIIQLRELRKKSVTRTQEM
jgi:hypothetical protein